MADPLQDWFKSLHGKLQRELSEKVRVQAERLADGQRAALRRQLKPPDDSGGLEQSIGVDEGRSGTYFTVRAGGSLTTKNGYDRAPAFEFGTRHQPARPFFFSTYRAMRDDIRDKLEEALHDAIEKS